MDGKELALGSVEKQANARGKLLEEMKKPQQCFVGASHEDNIIRILNIGRGMLTRERCNQRWSEKVNLSLGSALRERQ